MLEYTSQLAFTIIVQCFIAAYGLFAYVIVLKPLCQFRRTMFSKPFYTICFALALLDILNLIDRMCLCISDPLLPYTSPYILKIRSFYERFLHYGVACIELMIAMERAIVVFVPHDSKLVSVPWLSCLAFVSKFTFLQVLTNKMVMVSLAFFTLCIFATNICIFTSVCPYVFYPNTTVVFVDQSVPSAILHNRVVDLMLQPLLLCITLLLYFVTGFKVLKVRQKIQSQQMLPSVRKTKFEHVLVLLGLIVTIPHSMVIVVYHISFYVPGLPPWLTAVLDFTFQIMIVLGSSLNPILHLLLNKDLRQKTIESWCGNGILVPKSQNNYSANKSDVFVHNTFSKKFSKPVISVSNH